MPSFSETMTRKGKPPRKITYSCMVLAQYLEYYGEKEY